MPKPYWYTLIKRNKAEGIITTGLTIPYIFGAYKELGEPFTDIQSLVKTILNSETDKYPVIQKCDVINQHVVLLEDKVKCNKTYIKDVKIKSEDTNNILFVSTNTDLGKDLKKVCWNLSKEYENPILKGAFSWDNRGGIWKPFSKDETKLILSIK